MIDLRRRMRNFLNNKKPEIPAVFLPPVPEKKVEEKIVQNKTCPKCGKHCERGLHMHMKYCKAE